MTSWMTEIASSILPSARIPSNTKVGRVVSALFNINLSDYNPWNELSFLLAPTMKNFIEPMIYNLFSNLPDEKVIEVANAYIDSFIEQARKKGEINIFGINTDAKDFERLRDILSAIDKKDGDERQV